MAGLALDDLIGNDHIKAQLRIAQGAARLHNRALPHMLLAGLPGCGKTSTARALAASSGSPFVETNPESLKTAEDIQGLFDRLPLEGYDNQGEIVGIINPAIIFIDEAHRLALKSEEMLGIAMEEWKHHFTVGSGKKKEPLTSWVPRFTLVCATTKEGSLSKPFRDRFKLTYIFNEYSLPESVKMVMLHAGQKNVSIDENSAVRIAQRSRGTPRLIVRYLERVIDAMVVMARENITVDLVEAQFNLMGIDPEGLTQTDIIILKALHESDVPVGLESLALKTNQDQSTVKDTNEPYLIRSGFMERGKRGREITERGIEHLVKYKHITPQKKQAFGRILNK